MVEIKSNNKLYPFINVGMYHGDCNPDKVLADDYEKMSDAVNDNNWDNGKYEDFILKEASKIVTEKVLPFLKGLNLGIEDIKDFSIYSPKFYNYGDDELDFVIVYVDNYIDLFKSKVQELSESGFEFDKFLRDTFKSYAGFSSSMPKSSKELMRGLESEKEIDIDRACGALITYLMYAEADPESWQNSFIENVYTNAHIDMFLSNEVPDGSYLNDNGELRNLNSNED